MREGKKIILVPLTPKQVYEDQLAMRPRGEKSEREKNESVNHKSEKVDSKKHSEGRVRKSFFAKESEVRREFKKNEFMLTLVYKESYLNLSNTNDSLPSVVMSLL